MTSSRRTQMLDAAVDILAWQGSRALTHRAIDRLLSLPLGSAANYFQTRDALLRGIAERVIELDFASFGPIPEERVGRVFVAESIAAMILQWMEPPSLTRQRARHELLLHSVRDADLRAEFQRVRKEFLIFAARALDAGGCLTPHEHAPALVALYDGICLDQLYYADRAAGLDVLSDQVRQLLDGC